MGRPAVASALLALVGLAAGARDASADCGPASPGRPRVGLVLSGGGARGLAHIGFLSVLEEAGIRVDCVAGTSMGAAFGALWASGHSSASIEEIVRSIDWQQVFSGRRERALIPLSRRIDDVPSALSIGFEGAHVHLPPARESDYRLNRLLFKLLAAPGLRAGGDFDRLPVPFRTVATDLASAEPVVLSRGSLPRAVRASMSTPVTLPVVHLDGRVLVDGGIVDNIPVDVARAMGADVVIAVDVSSPPLKPEQYQHVLGVGLQLVDVLMRARAAAFAQSADLVVRPELEGWTFEDYSDPDAVIAIGRRAAEKAIDRLRETAAGGGPSVRAPAPPLVAPVVEVEVRGNHQVTAGSVRSAFGVRAGEPRSADELLRGYDRVWATGLFETAWLDVEPEAGGVKVVLDVAEKPRLAAELGVAYDEADQAGVFVRLRHQNLFGHGERLEVALLGSERESGARATLLGDGLWRWWLGYVAGGEIVEERPIFYSDGDSLGRAEFLWKTAWAGAQASFGSAAVARAYLSAGRVRSEPHPGLPLETADDEHRVLGGLLAWDRLDDRDLPRAGAAASARAESSLAGLGATRDYWRVRVDGRVAWAPAKPLVVEAAAALGLSDADVPDYQLFRLGGPVFLPGRPREERWGRQMLAAALSPGFDVRGFRLVLRAGAGNVWESRGEVSLGDLDWGVGAGVLRRTRFGPIALEGGVDQDGHGALYVSAGYSPARR
jgi:NTE family protein